jgi:hypothetical protein
MWIDILFNDVFFSQHNLSVMVTMHSLNEVNGGLQHLSVQSNKNCKIGICCFSATHAALWRKSGVVAFISKSG